jgi:hypothetical protein
MDRYVLIYDLDGEERREGFSTKKDRDAKIADLKTNRLVRSYGSYEMTEVERWERPAEEAKED